ncbi:MAG TPA: VOC family protein [Candidatus Dormibacteraeota bacterium]|jgi:catechol-2,3-dioxygenase|nr:VOC family protein [Candidatus Dormibacteraeota bacterium]
MRVHELGHIVLYVRDAARSAEFYREVLGWRQVVPPAGSGVNGFVMFSSGRTHHELLLIEVGDQAAPVPQGRRLGMYHFGLKVGDTDDELREARDRVLAAGAPLLGASDHGVTHSLYIADPDGNEIELYIDVPGVRWDDPAILAAPIRPLTI